MLGLPRGIRGRRTPLGGALDDGPKGPTFEEGVCTRGTGCKVRRFPADLEDERSAAERVPIGHGAPTNHLMSSKILNIGMYRAMIIAPTMLPRTPIITGSIRDVSDSVVDSTSWS